MFKLKSKSKKNELNGKKFTINFKKIVVFLIFMCMLSTVTVPVLIFYGPFENLKRIVVGTSWNTLKHQWIARIFLSDEAIHNILGETYAQDPTEQGGEIQMLEFTNKHTDKIEVYNIESDDFEGKMLLIYDPTRVGVGFSSKMPRSGETTSAIAKKNGAIAAINAGGFMDAQWAGTGGAPMGFIIKNNELIYDQLNNRDLKQETVAFTEKGMLIVGKHSITQLLSIGVKEAVSFGPPLIVNGKPTISKGDGGWGIAPRTAIGQREDGVVLLLVIDGRSLKSHCATLRDVQDILLQYKAVNAVNLDGGSSTTMYYDGKIINRPSDALGERTVPTAFIVMPSEEGGR